MDFSKIDAGYALEAAKHGDLQPLIQSLKNREELNDESIQWICDRLEGKKTANIKTGGKPWRFQKDADKRQKGFEESCSNYEMFVCFKWLTAVEKMKNNAAYILLSEIFCGKPESIRKTIDKMQDEPPFYIMRAAILFDIDEGKFLETKDNKYRPKALREYYLKKPW